MADTILGYPSTDPTLQEYSGFDFGFQEDYDHVPTTFDHYKQTGWGAYNPDAQPSLFAASRTTSSRATRANQMTDKAFASTQGPGSGDRANAAEDTKKVKTEGRKTFNFKDLVRGRSKSKSHRGTDAREVNGPPSLAFGQSHENHIFPMPQEDPAYTTLAQHDMSAYSHGDMSLQNFDMESAGFYDTMHTQLDHQSRPNMDLFGNVNNGEQYPVYNPGFPPAHSWINDLGEVEFTESSPDPATKFHTGLQANARSSRGSRTYPPSAYPYERHRSTSRPLHSELSRSKLRNHGSSQTLNSTVSSFGDSNGNMTPSDQGPVLPWLGSDYDSRRASDSSELAHNVEGMHLQYAPPNLGVVNSNLVPSPHSSAVSITGQITPDASPDQVIDKPFPYQTDLASRRQRSRPTPLRPESGRSTSVNDPLSHSPHSRSSSVGIAPGGAPRRTQSAAQSLNSQFRVHKLNPSPAQVSPRNLQAHLDKHALAMQRRGAAHSGTASPTALQMSAKPSTSAASANRSQADYQHEFHVRSASSGQENNPLYHISRHANASVPNLHSAVAQGPPQLSIHVPQAMNQMSYQHGLPQSAPPNKTTFFDDSPLSMHGSFTPPQSQPHQYSQAQVNQMTIGSNSMTQNAALGTQIPIAHLPPFAPQYLFPESPTIVGYPPQGLLPSYPPQPQPAQPAVELEIKIEVGPEPKLASTFEKCEFQHTFSDAFPHNDKK